MILKQYVERAETDPRRAAGVRAERQMAHYLDRHFRSHKRLHVLHDVRIEHDGDVAQVDHLVLHPFGAAIVESKSVTTSVRINSAGEWERQWDSRWRGMPDPILQGERQAIVLKRLLASRESELLDRVLGLIQGTFTLMALDVFAAISDEGTIRRAKPRQAPHAVKADAIPKALEDLVAGYRRNVRFLNLDIKAVVKAPRDFNEAELLRIGHFLRARSMDASGKVVPMTAQATLASRGPAVARAVSADELKRSTVVCRGCGSSDLEALVGKYGPYAKCRVCKANTPVRIECDGCGQRVRLTVGPIGFIGRCESCERRFEVCLEPHQ